MKDAKGHGSDKRGGGQQVVKDIAAQHGIPTDHLAPRGLGVDGMGMTPEEAGAHVAAGRMPLGPPLGVYRDADTYARFKAAKGK